MEKAELDFILLDKHDKLNRYNEYMWRKLHDSRSNPKAFWFYASFLLTRSTTYLISNIRKIHPTWYKSLTLKYIQQLIRKHQNLNLNKFNFKRVNIPKPDGNVRPLGVPEPAWRVYQTGLNKIVLIFLSSYMHPSQHGFIPERGTDTAWKEINEEVLKSLYIYEIDLDKFFDRINLDYLKEFLVSLQFPKHIIDQLIGWSRTMPRIGEERIKYCTKSTKERRFAHEESRWNAHTKAWAFKPNSFAITTRSYSTHRPKFTLLKQEKSTDLHWKTETERLNDLNTHQNSNYVSALDLNLRDKTQD